MLEGLLNGIKAMPQVLGAMIKLGWNPRDRLTKVRWENLMGERVVGEKEGGGG